MKKMIVILGICVLLLGIPMTSAMISPPIKTQTNPLPVLQKTPKILDEPPSWANGNFSGVWGLNVLGVPLEPSGWITGYYQNIGLGRLEAVFAEYNQTNATASLSGFMIWIFFLGGVRSLVTGNGTFVSGVGVANETHFYWRLNAIIGPSYYMFCNYTKFE